MKFMFFGFLILWLSFMPGHQVSAQTQPSATEIAAYSGLHAAAYKGDVAKIRQLAAQGVKFEVRDSNGRTPLHVAAFRSHDKAMAALVKAGANPNALENDRYDIVTIAAVADDLALMKLAFKLGCKPGNITSRYDGTALIAAAHLGHDGVVKALIKAGAPLDHINNLGWTALIEAVILGDGGKRHIETVRALVKAGANSKIADRNGVTPLMHARQRGFKAMVVILEKARK